MNASEIRDQLSHPVLDCDGHWIEPAPIFLEFLHEQVGARGVERYLSNNVDGQRWYAESPEERQRARRARPGWWAHPARTIDRATAMVPGLLYERLGEFGIDFSLVYSSLGLGLFGYADDDLRNGAVRALNCMNAELFAPYRDRLAPVAVVCTRTPGEAVEQLEHAVETLGMKAIVVNGRNNRSVEGGGPRDLYVDTIGLDSPYDYDPFWQRCVELGVAVTDHAGAWEASSRRSPTNYVFNHVGHFAEAMASSAKALFLGGITRRHPSLPFAFLEGGVGFACSLLLDLEGHWEKRNVDALERDLRPTNVSPGEFRALYDRYSGGRMTGKADDVLAFMWYLTPNLSLDDLADREVDLDEFEAVAIGSAEQLRAEFTRNFYFGCEPDDVMTALAFDRRLDLGLKPVFGSDIGHFDVPDMSRVLEEAWELVEDGLIDERDFERFTFANGVALHTTLNPDFFAGTVLEEASRRVASASRPEPALERPVGHR